MPVTSLRSCISRGLRLLHDSNISSVGVDVTEVNIEDLRDTTTEEVTTAPHRQRIRERIRRRLQLIPTSTLVAVRAARPSRVVLTLHSLVVVTQAGSGPDPRAQRPSTCLLA